MEEKAKINDEMEGIFLADWVGRHDLDRRTRGKLNASGVVYCCRTGRINLQEYLACLI